MPLRTTLALGATALALSALLGWIAGHALSNQAEHRSLDHAHMIAARFAERIDEVVRTGRRVLLESAASPSLGVPALRAHHAQTALEAIRREVPAFRWVAIADMDGRVVGASGDPGEGRRVAGQLAHSQAQRARRFAAAREVVLVPGIATAGPHGELEWYLELSVAVVDAAGRQTGMLLATLGWDWVAPQEAAGPPRGELLVVAADGSVLLSSDPAMIGRLVDTRLVARGARGMPSSATRRWPDGGWYRTVATPLPGHRDLASLAWTVVWRQPLDEADGLSRLLPTLGALAGALVCTLGLGLGFAWRRRVGSPWHAARVVVVEPRLR
jgi:hypothetical protein